MATSSNPVTPIPISGSFQQESNTFSSVNDLFRFFQPLTMKMSNNSPPVLNLDVTEGQWVFDKTALRLYTVINNTLRYVQFT